MVYVVTLPVGELRRIDTDLTIAQRFTKALPPETTLADLGPRLAIVLSTTATKRDAAETISGPQDRQIVWMGVVQRTNTVGPVDKSITIEPLRRCTDAVPIDGPQGLLSHLPEPHRAAFEDAMHSGDVGRCDWETWNALARTIHELHPATGRLLDWLIAQANAPRLDSNNQADRSWQEQRDALGTAVRISDIPLSTFAAWQRPTSPDAPYLAGLIPEPVENSMIDHDARHSVNDMSLFGVWRQNNDFRCDIHVMYDTNGRRLEVANVNATPVEGRLGTDLIYYHEPTHSFALVQYKRLESRRQSLTVDTRLLSQLDRLEAVAALSSTPVQPHDWRLGNDPCFLKLAYWPDNREPTHDLAPGMYLPLSYVRLLLGHDCTRGRGESRILGAETIDRYLVGSQFIELVKHGLAGTVGTSGTSVEQLRDFGTQRIEQGYSLVVAAESGSETVRQRQNRANRRSSKTNTRIRNSYHQQSLFDPQ